MTKRIFAIFTLFALITACFAGCQNNAGTNNNETTTGNGGNTLSIVSTIFPTYDFANQICGDRAEVSMLLPPGSESHSFEPSAKDIIKIQNCDLFIYVGGESDSWVDGILEAMDHPVKTMKMMDFVRAVEEDIVEGMQEEDESGDADDNEKEYDEHVWTSPKNAIAITRAIADAVSEIDAENSNTYKANTDAYVAKLTRLDNNFTEFFADVENKTLIFGDRFPFRYFADAYGIEYYAAFPGCSTETEASAGTIRFLIDKVNAENISTVFYIEFSSHKIADNIAEATNTKTALLHSCHSVSQADLNSGTTYLDLMEKNLETLKDAIK